MLSVLAGRKRGLVLAKGTRVVSVGKEKVGSLVGKRTCVSREKEEFSVGKWNACAVSVVKGKECGQYYQKKHLVSRQSQCDWSHQTSQQDQ